MNYNTGCNGTCDSVLCAQYGCLKQMAGIGTEGNGYYTYVQPVQPVQPPRGCICPPGANKECENQYCPRKALPVSAHIEVKK